MKNLTKRALTALIFAAIMLGGLMWNRISFSILLLIIQTGCLFEYLVLVRKFQNYPEKTGKIAFIITMIFSSAVFATIVFLYAIVSQQQTYVSIIFCLAFLPVFSSV